MPTAGERSVKKRLSYIEESLPEYELGTNHQLNILDERDVDQVGPEKIEFETQSQVPGDQSLIERRDRPFEQVKIMGQTKEAEKNSLDLLNVKSKKPKETFDKEENLSQVDRSPGDSLYGDDKETQGRHIRNMKGPGGLKTGMVKKAELNVGDDITSEGEVFKVQSIDSNGVIARHAFTSMDRHFDGDSFSRIASASFKEEPQKIEESSRSPLFFEAASQEGLFPVNDDTLPE